jgi:hypothetical protein
MTEHKNLLITLGEWWETRKSRAGSATAQPHPGGGLRLLRWLLPNGGTLLLIALLIATQSIWAQPFAATNAPGPSATTVNYQGRLADNVGVPLDGSYGMSFALYDAASAGNLVWGPEDHPAVPVSDGLFSVGLGSRTTGGIPTTTWNGDRYLEITVGGETLSPRELIRSVPIAGMALTVPDGAIGSSQIADGAVGASHIAEGAIGSSQIADGAITESKLAPNAIPVGSNTHSNWSGEGSDSVVMVDNATYLSFPGTETVIEVSEPSRILIVSNASLRVIDGDGFLYTAICRDDARLSSINFRGSVEGLTHESQSLTLIDTVDAGTYTYTLCSAGSAGLEIRWWRPIISLVAFPGQ